MKVSNEHGHHIVQCKCDTVSPWRTIDGTLATIAKKVWYAVSRTYIKSCAKVQPNPLQFWRRYILNRWTDRQTANLISQNNHGVDKTSIWDTVTHITKRYQTNDDIYMHFYDTQRNADRPSGYSNTPHLHTRHQTVKTTHIMKQITQLSPTFWTRSVWFALMRAEYLPRTFFNFLEMAWQTGLTLGNVTRYVTQPRLGATWALPFYTHAIYIWIFCIISMQYQATGGRRSADRQQQSTQQKEN